jgi:hypothetical protein
MLRERLIALTEPLLARLGYELVDVEYAATRSEATLRVFIDWPEGVRPGNWPVTMARGPSTASVWRTASA